MSEGIGNIKEDRACSLREGFESNISMIKKKLFGKMKKFHSLQFLSTCRTIVYMVKERNQMCLMKIYLVRQTRCTKKSWFPLQFHHGIV